MFDSSFDRTLSYRLGAAYDCWGHRRHLRPGVRNGIWFVDTTACDEPETQAAGEPADIAMRREALLRRFAASGRFTPTEIATLRAIAIERLSIAEVAERDGCTRQAVVARLTGNSRGQGGVLKKVLALRATSVPDLTET